MREFSVLTQVTYKRVADLLITAFDPVCRAQAIGYWCEQVAYERPSSPHLEFQAFPEEVYAYCDYPLNKHGAMILTVEGKRYRLNLDSIQRGLNTFAEKYPRHYGDFLDENEDITTADVFVQCCIFGDCIYS